MQQQRFELKYLVREQTALQIRDFVRSYLDMAQPVGSFPQDVILELKFTNRYPDWFRELIRVFNVQQCGAAKYVESVQGLGSRLLEATGAVVEEGSRLTRY